MNENISHFFQENTCANIACLDASGNPYCFSCFYAVNIPEALLYFKSSADSNHAGFLQSNPNVAGTVLPDKLNTLQIKGIQLSGTVLSFDDPLAAHAATHYYKTHPMAMAMLGEIWTIKINWIKYTDNTLGFGKKLIWERPVN